MKRSIMMVGLVSLLAVGLCQAQVTPKLDQGTQEIAGFGSFISDAPGGDLWNLQLSYGYFVRDQLQLGITGGYADDDSGTVFDIGVGGEYNFLIDGWGAWVPYAGADILGLYVDPEVGSRESTAALSFAGGMKYFIHDNVALGLTLEWNYAFDDVFVDQGGSVSDNRWLSLFTIRVYY